MVDCMTEQNDKNTKQQILQVFAEKEKARMEQEKAVYMEDKGYSPFWTMSEGTFVVVFADQPPRENKFYPNRPIFKVQVDETEFDYSINKNSPFYRSIMESLAKGVRKLSITRIGTGKTDTRYSVKEVV